jgi:hypothetical protein
MLFECKYSIPNAASIAMMSFFRRSNILQRTSKSDITVALSWMEGTEQKYTQLTCPSLQEHSLVIHSPWILPRLLMFPLFHQEPHHRKQQHLDDVALKEFAPPSKSLWSVIKGLALCSWNRIKYACTLSRRFQFQIFLSVDRNLKHELICKSTSHAEN